MKTEVELRKKIWIVEDDPAMRMFLGRVLRGRDVSFFGSGISVFKEFSNGKLPDLIISDIRLPMMNGIALLRQLKSSGIYSSIPVIILSGSVDERQINECKQLGAYRFISKPFDPEYFVSVVDDFFECCLV